MENPIVESGKSCCERLIEKPPRPKATWEALELEEKDSWMQFSGAGGATAVGGSKIKSRRSKLRCTAPLRSFFSQGLDITASTQRSKASTIAKSAKPLPKITIAADEPAQLTCHTLWTPPPLPT